MRHEIEHGERGPLGAAAVVGDGVRAFAFTPRKRHAARTSLSKFFWLDRKHGSDRDDEREHDQRAARDALRRARRARDGPPSAAAMSAVGTLVTTKYSAENRWLSTSSIHAATHHAIKPEVEQAGTKVGGVPDRADGDREREEHRPRERPVLVVADEVRPPARGSAAPSCDPDRPTCSGRT